MSLPEDNVLNKIEKVDNCELKADCNSRLRASTSSQKDDQIPKTPKENKGLGETVTRMEGLVLSPDSSEDNICNMDWLKAKDSLESLLYPKIDVLNSKSTSCTMSKEKHLMGDSPLSESVIGASKNGGLNSVSRVLAWDPWDRLGKKNKKETRRRKYDKSSRENSRTTSPQDKNRKDYKSGDEVHAEVVPNAENYMENYEYQQYQPKNSRSVEFTNKVMVVYIKEDKVIGETTEPLKKELEQQIRNKEMRKGHMSDIPFGKRRALNDHLRK